MPHTKTKIKTRILSEEVVTQFSEENSIPEATAKKILSVVYSKGMDAKNLESVIWRMEMFLKKTMIPDLMSKMTPEQIGVIIDEMIAEREPCEDCNTSPVCCNEQDFHVWGFTEMTGEQFAEKKFEAGDNVELQIARVGKWDHPMYGEIEITTEVLNDLKKNFDTNARGIELAVDENHDEQHKALGWFRDVKKKGKDSLFATIELTKKWAELLTEWAYKYFSPEIVFNKRDEEKGTIIKNLLLGGAFTNRPFFKAMQPLLANEDFSSHEAANRHQINWKFSDSESNILFFNTSQGMKKLLELLAKFCEQEKISKEQLAELETAFAEVNPDFVTAEMTSAVEEIKAKFTEEAAPEAAPAATDPATPADPAPADPVDPAPSAPAEPKEPTDPAPVDPVPASDPAEPEKAIEANEKGEVTMKFSDYENLKNLAADASKLVREARKHTLEKKVEGLVFSESNKIGVALPKNKQEIVDFALSLSEKQGEKFLSIIGNLQTIASGELGHSEGAVFSEEEAEQVTFFTEKMWMTPEQASEAIKAARATLNAKK